MRDSYNCPRCGHPVPRRTSGSPGVGWEHRDSITFALTGNEAAVLIQQGTEGHAHHTDPLKCD